MRELSKSRGIKTASFPKRNDKLMIYVKRVQLDLIVTDYHGLQ